MKRVWFVLAALLLIILVIIGVSRSKKQVGIEITVATATSGTFVREVSGTGNIEAHIYTLSFNRAAHIERVLVHEGEHVHAGAVLAELSSAPEHEDLAATREKLHAMQVSLQAQEREAGANLQKLDIQLAETRKQLNLTRQLFTAGTASLNEVDTLEHQLATQTAEREAQAARAISNRRDLSAQLTSLQAQIRTDERILRDSRLTAPVSGAISQIDFRVGETAQGAVKLVEDGTLRAKVRMAEADTVGVSVGQTARVELDANPDHPLSARVERLGVSADIQGQGSSSILPVTLTFLDARAATEARPGFTATGRITTLRLPSALQVPLEALVEETTDGQKHCYVWVVDTKALTASRQEVTVTARNLTAAAIQGLPAGATVVTMPPDTLKAGAKVRIKPADTKPKG